MPDTLLTSASEFQQYEGGTGNYRSQAVTDALILAEGKVEEWLNTAVVPTTATEEYPWPIDDGRLMLRKVRLISLGTITGLHSPNCSCVWQEISDCAFIYNARQSIISVVDCQGVAGRCWPCRCPQRVRVTYTYGFTATEAAADTKDGRTLRSGIFAAAVGFLQSGIGLGASGNQNIGSFSSAGYSESRNFNERSGAEELVNPMIQQAKEMVRGLRIYRNPFYRARKGVMR